MKPLETDELFHNLKSFLKAKGLDLTDGAYAQAVQKSCNLLGEAINLGQKGVGRAKDEIDKKLEQMRQVIHEKTAPRRPATGATGQTGRAPRATARPGSSKTKRSRRRKSPPRKPR